MKNFKIFKSGFYEKLKLLLVLLGVLRVGINQTWAGNNIAFQSGAYFYFNPYYDATNTVNQGSIQIAARKYQNDGQDDYSWYTPVTALSNIEHTRLYYTATFHGPEWGGAKFHGWAVISNASAKSDADTEYWTSGNSTWYSHFKTYGMNSGNTYLFIASSATNGETIDHDGDEYLSAGYTGLNHSQTVHRYTCVNGYDFTAAEVNSGTVSISAYKMTDNGTASNTSNSATINTAATTSVNVDAAYTGEVTVTATAATGYVFLGWYNGSGTKLNDQTSYTYNAPNADYAVYARFAPKYAVGRTIYMRIVDEVATGKHWYDDNPRYAAVFGNATTQQWVDCSTISAKAIYSVNVPSGNWGYVIFCRMNPSDSENKWDNRYNQTQDMMDNGANNCANVNAWNGAEWRKYAPSLAIVGDFNDWDPVANPLTDNAVTIENLAADKAYYFKVAEGYDTSWWGYGDTNGSVSFIGQTSKSATLVANKSNMLLLTGGAAGNYTFTWDATNKKLSVAFPDRTAPSTRYIYYKNTKKWAVVHGHAYDTHTSAWPGPQLDSIQFAGTYYQFMALGDNVKAVINQGSDASQDNFDSDITANKGKYWNGSAWTAFTVSVALNNQSAVTAGASSVTATYNAALPSIATTKPARGSYTFGGYYDEVGGGGTQYIAGDGTSAHAWDKTTASPTLYAKWTLGITLNNQSADSGKEGTSSVTVTYNSNSNMTSAIIKPQKTGYIFSGYYTLLYGSGKQIIDADGNFNTSVTDFITDGKWTNTGSSPVTLYAYWKKECSASAYTIRYYTSGVAYESECFEQVGETHEWNITDFAIPSHMKYSVGYNEDVYESGLGTGDTKSSSVEKLWTDTYSKTDNIGNGAMQLLPAGASARAVGQATGAVGKLVIWDNSSDKNLSVGFLPNGYGVTTADNTYAFTLGDGNFCYTDPVTISSTEAAGNFQVKLATSSSYAACAQGTAEAASAVNGRKISGDANIANSKKGVFQMWRDATANNFGLRFVTVHDVTFNMQGHGSAISAYENVRYNDKIGAPSAPTQAGYSFGGWYKDEDCTDDWDFANDVVTENTTLYAKWSPVTLTFVGGYEAGEWNDTRNWTPACIPTIDHDVVLQASATLYGRFGGVSGHGRAKSIKIDKSTDARKNIRLSIWTCSSLIVAEDITAKHVGDGDFGAVNAEDLYIETTVLGNGVLICGSANANTAATYDFHSKAYKADNKWYINQYVGIPFAELDADKMRGFNIFVYDDAEDDWRTPGSNTMNPWTAYDLLCIYPGGVGNQELKGTLLFPGTGEGKTKTLSCTRRNSEEAKWTKEHPFPTSIDGTAGHQDHMFANSWTAPIDIAAMEESDFTHLVHTIYIFNAGYEGDGVRVLGDDAGQWSSFPLAAVKAGEIENAVIPATQAFLVTDTASGSSITLDYKTHVYDPAKATSDANDTINNFPTRAPRRVKKSSSLNSLKMFVRSEEDVIADRLYIIEGNNLRTDTFDNGWDGNKIMGESFAPQLYSMSGTSKMYVNAVKDMEGMKIGFKAGAENQEYTLSFDYEEQAEPLYLYDKETNAYTEITNEATYEFTTTDRKAHERFLLTRSNSPQIATGVEEIDTENVQRAQKFMQDQQIFIRRGDKVYSIDGALVK